MDVLKVENVTKAFGDYKAVNEVSFSVPKGTIYGILGPNGAGKTTTIRMINAITYPDSGAIFLNGEKVGSKTQEKIGYLPEERGLYKKMKVGEHLLYLAQLKGMEKAHARTVLREWLERFEALDWIGKEIGELSKGMQQKVQFISTIAHDPDIYIFDEPFSGLDPINSEILKNVILELRDKGKTIIFSTHRMEQVEQMCDFICLYNHGKMILEGSLSKIKHEFGRNTVILEFDGNPGFLDSLRDVRMNNKSTRYAELRLLDGADHQHILRTALQHVEVHRFELVQPSLNEIFISTVGEDNLTQEEKQLLA